MVCYVTVIQIQSVFFRAERHHGVRALKTERLRHVGGGQREFLGDYLILAPLQIFEIYDNVHIGGH